jgi:hypothetical protein
MILPNRPRARGRPRFIVRFLPTQASATTAVHVETVVVLGVGDGRLQALLHVARDAALGEGEVGQRLVHLLAADHAGDEVQLLRRGASACADFAIASLSATRRGFFSLPMAYFLFAFLSAA